MLSFLWVKNIPPLDLGPDQPVVGWKERLRTWPRRLRLGWSRKVFPGKAGEDIPFLRRWGMCLLTLLAASLFFLQLHQPLLDPDEGRQAEIPREMLENGDWLVPTWRGRPYYEKPPLQYWLTATLYLLFGVAPATARLVPATAALLTVLVTYSWGRRALGDRAGFLAGVLLCLTPGFFLLARTIVLDSMLTLAVVSAWFTAFVAVQNPQLKWRYWLLAALLCGLGILQKGPVSVVLVLVPVTAYSYLQSGTARLGWRPLAAFLLVAGSVALPWYAAMAFYHPDYLETFLWRSHVLRFMQPFDHRQPWWFYFPVLFLGTFPWSLLAPGLVVFLLSRKIAPLRPAGMGLPLLAFAWCFAFYSLSGCKSPPYMMPTLPPLALLAGAFLDALLFHEAAAYHPFLQMTRRALPLVTSLVLLLLAPLVFYLAGFILPGTNWFWWPGLACACAMLLAWWLVVRHSSAVWVWGFLGLLTFLVLAIPVKGIFWAHAERRSPENIVEAARPFLERPDQKIVLFDRDWFSVHFYLRRQELNYFYWPTQKKFQRFVQRSLEGKDDSARVVVLVDAGPKLATLVKTLPAHLEVQVFHASAPGQLALVVLGNARQNNFCQGNRVPMVQTER
jgi:4-amino-4-deoxy-L-arabinose transferase-like glycosyltransferase